MVGGNINPGAIATFYTDRVKAAKTGADAPQELADHDELPQN
jgi:hypothetical protein